MCLPDFERFEQVDKDSPMIGYRNWRILISSVVSLVSGSREYVWKSLEGPHLVLDRDSGIYSYNNYYNNNYYNYNYNYNYNNNYYYYNYYYNNNNYYNYNNYNYNNNNYYNYYNYYNLAGIINQWGKVAIHKTGYRSEYAKIVTLFTIRESDAKGPDEFLNWIKEFNQILNNLAQKYECDVISYQDYKEINK